MRSRITIFVVLALCLLFTASAWSQEIMGSIVGTVKDATGAVIPNATVTVKNTDQNVVLRTMKTDGNGYYNALALPVAHYSVTVEAEGFKKFVKTAIKLNVNDKLTVNVDMQVGGSTQVVEVESNPVVVDLQSSTGAGTITGNQVRNLTLTNRNYQQLTTLMPGVSNTGSEQYYIGLNNPITGEVNTLGISVNGSRTSANNWTLDGADNVDRGSNLSTLMTPSIDSIGEFKVLRNNYGAEFGRAGGAQINVVTKSGTSAFHGTAFEFWKDKNLSADSYFAKQSYRYYSPTADCKAQFPGKTAFPDCDTRKAFHYHNFGGTFGGPLYIPGLYNTKKDKTFFFYSEEFRRVITYGSANVMVPTADMMKGIFPTGPNGAALICTSFDPAGKCLATGNQITNIDPLAQAYIKDIWSKMPNLSTDPYNTYVRYPARNVNNYREELLKIDHVFGPRLSVYGRYIHDAIPTEEPWGLFGPNSYLPGVGNTKTDAPGWSLVGRATATFSPNTLLEAGYNYTYGAILSDPTGLMNSANSPDIKATLPFPTTLNSVPGVGSSYFAGLGTHPHYEDYNRNQQAFANFTKVVGKHNFKFGATYYHYQKAENAAGSNSGSFVFGYYGAISAPTGYCSPTCPQNGNSATTQMRIWQSWANFLMGKATSFSQASLDMYPDIRDNQWEMFAQDEFRVTPRLTVTYGMRYSLFRQPTDATGMLTNFDPKFYDPAQAPALDPKTGNILNPSTSNLLNGIAPTTAAIANCQKLLAAKQLTYCWPEGTKAPYGDKAGKEFNKAFAPRIGLAWDPFGDGKTSIRSGFGLSYDTNLFGVVEQNIFGNAPFVQSLSLSPNTPTIPFGNPTGNLSISSIPKAPNSRVDPNYFTPYTMNWNLGIQRQLTSSTVLDISYVGSRSNHLLGYIDANAPKVGEYLKHPELATWNAANGGVDEQALLGATAECTKPQNLVNNDYTSGPNGANCSYNHAMLNLIRPYKGWGPIQALRTSFMSNYHALQMSLDKRFKGDSQIGASYTWSHALTNNQTDRSTAPQDSWNPMGDYGPTQQDRRHIFSGNFVYELPFFKSQKGFVGHVLGGWQLSGITQMQTGTPLTITDGTNSWDLAGEGCRVSTSPCSVRPDLIGDPTAYTGAEYTAGKSAAVWKWFNPAAFASIPKGQARPGNSPRGVIYTPGMWRQDLSFMRNIKFTERFSAQLRADAFNAFNHTNPSGIVTSMTSTQFGQITGTGLPRQIQVGMKLMF
ncbi:MAG TPA: TonB-dependent receptor [Terriglobales bacterium]|nr:TonB-dependent receptor [Terriglobales bacterium]